MFRSEWSRPLRNVAILSLGILSLMGCTRPSDEEQVPNPTPTITSSAPTTDRCIPSSPEWQRTGVQYFRINPALVAVLADGLRSHQSGFDLGNQKLEDALSKDSAKVIQLHIELADPSSQADYDRVVEDATLASQSLQSDANAEYGQNYSEIQAPVIEDSRTQDILKNRVVVRIAEGAC